LDNTRFYQLKIDLANSMTMQQDKFPKTTVETHGLLNDYKTPPRQQRAKDPDSNGVAFVQNRPPHEVQMAADIDCWHCQKKGHYEFNCPKLQAQELDVGVQNLNIDICDKAHSLFSANEGLTMVQEKKGEIRSGRHPLEAPRVHQHMHQLRKYTIPQTPGKYEEASARPHRTEQC
jgi:hypothetical protein